MTKKLRRLHKTLTSAERRRYAAAAEQVDREEKQNILATGREVFAEHERLLLVVDLLRQERQRQGLSLTELADRTGIDEANLARLEHGGDLNPTIATLERIAAALGKDVLITLSDRRAS